MIFTEPDVVYTTASPLINPWSGRYKASNSATNDSWQVVDFVLASIFPPAENVKLCWSAAVLATLYNPSAAPT